MTRYVLKDTDRPGFLAVFDNTANELVEELPTTEAAGRARQLNYAERGRKSRHNRWEKPARPANFNARIVELRDAGLSFLAIADLLDVTVQVAHRIYHLEDKKRIAEALLADQGLNDSTPIDRLAHRLPEKVYQSLAALNVGLGERGTVGFIRRAPDALLLSLEGIGHQHLKTIREVFGCDPDTQDISVAAFAKLMIDEGVTKMRSCS